MSVTLTKSCLSQFYFVFNVMSVDGRNMFARVNDENKAMY